MPSYTSLPGFRDFYPAELAVRSHIMKAWREVARRYAFEEYDGPFSGGDEAGKVAAAVGGTNIAVILGNHGLLTVGATVGSAAYRFMIFDRSVRVQILAEQAGTPRHIRDDVASALAGSEEHCTASFEPILRALLARYPDIDSR